MSDKMDLAKNVNSENILRDLAEEELSKSPDATQGLKDKTPEEISHELHVHQIELEMQNEELKRIQLELEDSRNKYQDKYQKLYDFAPVGYLTLTHKGIIKEINLTGAALIAMPRSKLIKRGFGHFVARECLDQWDEHIITVLGQEEKQTCELTLRREDESSFYARLDSIRMDTPAELQGETREPHVIHMTVTDITESKCAEDALRENEIKYRRLFETMAQGVVYQDASGRIDSANPAAERILGLTVDQLSQRTSENLQKGTIYEDGSIFPGNDHPSMKALRTGLSVRNVTIVLPFLS